MDEHGFQNSSIFNKEHLKLIKSPQSHTPTPPHKPKEQGKTMTELVNSQIPQQIQKISILHTQN